jgi:hypothetical protein
VRSRGGNILFFGIVIVVIIVLGFIREFVFINLNNQLAVAYYREFQNTHYAYPLPVSLGFLSSLSYSALSNLRWVFSAAFALLYFIITIIAIGRVYPGTRHRVKIIAAAFGLLIALAGIFYLYGMASGNWERAYPLSLTFSHLAQSPVVLMVLVPAFKLAQAGIKKS